MDIQQEKKQIEKAVVDTLITSLDSEAIKEEDLSIIADYVLWKLDAVYTTEDLKEFLKELSERWEIFTPLLILGHGEMKEKVENEVAQGVLTLAKSGKIEDAIKLAKTQTQTTVPM